MKLSSFWKLYEVLYRWYKKSIVIEWIFLAEETIIDDLKLFNKEVPWFEISHRKKNSLIWSLVVDQTPQKKTLFSKNIAFYPPKITQQRFIIIKEAAIVYIDFMDRWLGENALQIVSCVQSESIRKLKPLSGDNIATTKN